MFVMFIEFRHIHTQSILLYYILIYFMLYFALLCSISLFTEVDYMISLSDTLRPCVRKATHPRAKIIFLVKQCNHMYIHHVSNDLITSNLLILIYFIDFIKFYFI